MSDDVHDRDVRLAVQLAREEGDELLRQHGCRRALDHAAAVGMAREAAEREASADRQWMREHFPDVMVGFACGLMLSGIALLIFLGFHHHG